MSDESANNSVEHPELFAGFSVNFVLS
jgi:hypothetical protein